MLHPAKAFFHFLIHSKNQYGVHSPFLFDYMTKGLKNQDDIKLDKVILLRKELVQNKLEIEVTDFGAGSKVFNRSALYRRFRVCILFFGSLTAIDSSAW